MNDNNMDGAAPTSAADLRARAEALERANSAASPAALAPLSPEETRQTLHELRVHQIELEMQNEELRRAQTELAASRARYFDLYDLAPTGYITVSEKGLILEANLTVANMLGVTRTALVKQPVSLFILKNDQDGYYRSRELLFKTQQRQTCEVRLLKKDGSAFWARLDATLAQGAGGISVSRIVLSDITEHKRAEQALRDSEEQFRSLASLAPAGIYLCTPDGLCEFANPRWCEMAGMSLQEALGNGWLAGLHPEDRAAVLADWQKMVASKGRWGHEYRFRTPDGKVTWVFGLATPQYDEVGRIVRYIGINLDITERKRAEAALRESEERFRVIASSTPDHVLVQDRDLRYTFVLNPQIGLTESDMIGKMDRDFLEREDAEKLMVIKRKVLETGEPCHMTVPVLNRRGETEYFEGAFVPKRDSTGAIDGLMGYFRNITERKRAEEALTLAKEAAEKANEAKSQFLAVMSHELRTPLNPILGFADLLAESPNLTEEQHVWLQIISQRGQDLLGLIGSVLDLSAIEAQKITVNREPLLPRQALKDLADSVRPAAVKKGLRLDWDVAEDVPDRVEGDGLRLRQILLNLLTNALKFTKSGGIAVRVQDGRAARLMREPSAGETALLFSIRDTGIGIAADRQAAIFEAFTHADSKEMVQYGGAGLGLTIAAGLVELMDGRIWVESTPGEGSTFWFTVLVGVSPAATLPEPADSGVARAEAAVRTLNVLIVEDDWTNLKMAELLVKKAGHRVQSAMHGRQAVAMAEAEAFDLILMDVQMPIMDGIEATKLIREREAPLGRHTRIIAVTAYAMQGDRERLLAAGMDGYLMKPVPAARLREALDAVG